MLLLRGSPHLLVAVVVMVAAMGRVQGQEGYQYQDPQSQYYDEWELDDEEEEEECASDETDETLEDDGE